MLFQSQAPINVGFIYLAMFETTVAGNRLELCTNIFTALGV